MNESTWTAPKPWCPHPERYSAPDKLASESEVSEFVGNLVQVLHAENVLETGAYLGHTTERIGRALRAQGYGHCDSLEVVPRYAAIAQGATLGLPVTIHHCDSRDFDPGETRYDLMFFDSSYEARAPEMDRFKQNASDRCVWVLHDAYHPAIESLGHNHGGLFIPTPRGFMMGYWGR